MNQDKFEIDGHLAENISLVARVIDISSDSSRNVITLCDSIGSYEIIIHKT